MENNESKTPKKSTTTSTEKKSTTKPADKKPTTTNSTKPVTTAKKPSDTSSVLEKKATTPQTPKTSSTTTIKPSATKSDFNSVNTKSTPPKTAPKAGVASSQPKPSAIKSNELKPQVKEINQNNLNKDLIAEDNEEEKKKKKKFIIIIFFIILGLALLGVGIYFITRIPKSEINFDIQIEAVIETTFENEYGEIEEYKYVPGDLIKGQLKIKIDDLNSTIATSDSVFLRFKISAEVDNNYYSGLFFPLFNKEDDWYGAGAGVGEESADNYYYYCLRCYDNTEIIVFDYLDFVKDKENNMLNGKTAKLIFTVEILEGNYSAIGQEWHTAPNEWRTMVR